MPLRFSELKNRADLESAPPVKECRLLSCSPGCDTDFNINPESICPTPMLHMDEFSELPVSGIALSEYYRDHVDGLQVVRDYDFASWAALRDGKIYQSFIPFNSGAGAVAFSDIDVAKPQYVYDPVAGAFTTELNGNYGTGYPVPYTKDREGSDPYKGIHLFTWFQGNGARTSNGISYITKKEGDGVVTTGAADVYTYGPTFWWRVTSNVTVPGSSEKGQLWEICDSPKPIEEGWYPWIESVRGYTDGDIDKPIVAPYWCHPTYVAGTASDGIPRSQPGLTVLTTGTSYASVTDGTFFNGKGEGYRGGDMATMLFAIIFNVIKNATKDEEGRTQQSAGTSNTGMRGCTNYSTYNYIKSDATDTNQLVVSVQGYYKVGDYVSVEGKLAPSMVTAVDESTAGQATLTLDKTFTVAANDLLNPEVPPTGTTEVLKKWGKVDGNYGDNNGDYLHRGHQPFLFMGTEYMPGHIVLATDVLYNADDKVLYWCRRGEPRYSDPQDVKTHYDAVPVPTDVGSGTVVDDIVVDVKRGIFTCDYTYTNYSEGWGAKYEVGRSGWCTVRLGGARTDDFTAGFARIHWTGTADRVYGCVRG